MEQSRARPFTYGFPNYFLSATRSSNQDTENWAPRRGLLAGTEKRQIRVEVFETCFTWGNSGNTCTNTQMAAACALYVAGSIPCQVTLSHNHKLCFPASPQFLLKDLSLPCSSSGEDKPWHLGPGDRLGSCPKFCCI